MRKKVLKELEATLGPAWTLPARSRRPPPPGALREPTTDDEQEDSPSADSGEPSEGEQEPSISYYPRALDSNSDSEEEGSTIEVDCNPRQVDEEDSSLLTRLKMGPIAPKRKATEEPNAPSDSKRIKSSHDDSTEPDESKSIVVKRIPFPEKVCYYYF